MCYRYRSGGFTIIELMIVLAVLSIIALVAVPNFREAIESNRVSTETNRLVSAINYARSEAVRVGDDVTLTADNGGFAEGWCVHLGGNCAGDDVLRQFDGGNVAYDADANQITFNSRGEQDDAGFTIEVEPNDCEAGASEKRRVVRLSLSGRASVEREDC